MFKRQTSGGELWRVNGSRELPIDQYMSGVCSAARFLNITFGKIESSGD
jgi:hypothetical protein